MDPEFLEAVMTAIRSRMEHHRGYVTLSIVYNQMHGAKRGIPLGKVSAGLDELIQQGRVAVLKSEAKHGAKVKRFTLTGADV